VDTPRFFAFLLCFTILLDPKKCPQPPGVTDAYEPTVGIRATEISLEGGLQ